MSGRPASLPTSSVATGNTERNKRASAVCGRKFKPTRKAMYTLEDETVAIGYLNCLLPTKADTTGHVAEKNGIKVAASVRVPPEGWWVTWQNTVMITVFEVTPRNRWCIKNGICLRQTRLDEIDNLTHFHQRLHRRSRGRFWSERF